MDETFLDTFTGISSEFQLEKKKYFVARPQILGYIACALTIQPIRFSLGQAARAHDQLECCDRTVVCHKCKHHKQQKGEGEKCNSGSQSLQTDGFKVTGSREMSEDDPAEQKWKKKNKDNIIGLHISLASN